jgi:hypothetical protein
MSAFYFGGCECCGSSEHLRAQVKISIGYNYFYPGGPQGQHVAWLEDLRQRVLAMPYPDYGQRKFYNLPYVGNGLPPSTIDLGQPVIDSIPQVIFKDSNPARQGYRTTTSFYYGTTVYFSVSKTKDLFATPKIGCRVRDSMFDNPGWTGEILEVSEIEMLPEQVTSIYLFNPYEQHIEIDFWLPNEGGPASPTTICAFPP